MAFVYILTNRRDGVLYIGCTVDLDRRMLEHRTGAFRGFSRKYNCTRLVFVEAHDCLESARIREKQMKAWKRAWKIELIEKDNPDWLDLADSAL